MSGAWGGAKGGEKGRLKSPGWKVRSCKARPHPAPPVLTPTAPVLPKPQAQCRLSGRLGEPPRRAQMPVS